MKRLILSAMMVAALLIGGFGCMGINFLGGRTTKEPELNVNDVALLRMEEKYGEKFEYVRPWSDSMSGTRQFMAKCDSLPGQEVLVQIENFRDKENQIYRDNYLAVKYREQTAAFFHDCATSVFGEANIYYEVANDGLSPDLSADATLQEFLADTRVTAIAIIEVKQSSFNADEQTEKVAELIAQSGINYQMMVVVMDDSVFGTFDQKALGKELSLSRFIHCAEIIRRDGNTKIRWLDRED